MYYPNTTSLYEAIYACHFDFFPLHCTRRGKSSQDSDPMKDVRERIGRMKGRYAKRREIMKVEDRRKRIKGSK